MKASELEPGDVLIDRTMNAEPTRIAEVDLEPSGVAANSVAIRFACQENWHMLGADGAVEIANQGSTAK